VNELAASELFANRDVAITPDVISEAAIWFVDSDTQLLLSVSRSIYNSIDVDSFCWNITRLNCISFGNLDIIDNITI
jgi:hypothetical protein